MSFWQRLNSSTAIKNILQINNQHQLVVALDIYISELQLVVALDIYISELQLVVALDIYISELQLARFCLPFQRSNSRKNADKDCKNIWIRKSEFVARTQFLFAWERAHFRSLFVVLQTVIWKGFHSIEFWINLIEHSL